MRGGRRAWPIVLGLAGGLLAVPPAGAGEVPSIALALVEGRVSGDGVEPGPGAPVLRLRQGETVALVWTSDVALELHLHGYDILLEVRPGAPATLPLDARATGRFPLTVHGDGPHHAHHATLLYLEVLPR